MGFALPSSVSATIRGRSGVEWARGAPVAPPVGVERPRDRTRAERGGGVRPLREHRRLAHRRERRARRGGEERAGEARRQRRADRVGHERAAPDLHLAQHDHRAGRGIDPDRAAPGEHRERRPLGQRHGTLARQRDVVARADGGEEVGVVVDPPAIVGEEEPVHGWRTRESAAVRRFYHGDPACAAPSVVRRRLLGLLPRGRGLDLDVDAWTCDVDVDVDGSLDSSLATTTTTTSTTTTTTTTQAPAETRQHGRPLARLSPRLRLGRAGHASRRGRVPVGFTRDPGLLGRRATGRPTVGPAPGNRGGRSSVLLLCTGNSRGSARSGGLYRRWEIRDPDVRPATDRPHAGRVRGARPEAPRSALRRRRCG